MNISIAGMNINIDRKAIDSVILALLILVLRRDFMLALVIGGSSYALRMVNWDI
jgi:hypothetical protein